MKQQIEDYQRAVLAWHAVLVTPTDKEQRQRVTDLWFEACEFSVTVEGNNKWDNRRPHP